MSKTLPAKAAAVLFAIELFEPNQKSHRGVLASPDGKMHIGTINMDDTEFVAEVVFEPQEAIDLAVAIMSGNPQAVTKPGAGRMLAAALLDRVHKEVKEMKLPPVAAQAAEGGLERATRDVNGLPSGEAKK